MEQVTQPLFNLRESIDLKHHMNSRRMSELHRSTYYPLIISLLSAEGTNSSVYKEGKVLQEMQKIEASHKARRGHRIDEQRGRSESTSSKCVSNGHTATEPPLTVAR